MAVKKKIVKKAAKKKAAKKNTKKKISKKKPAVPGVNGSGPDEVKIQSAGRPGFKATPALKEIAFESAKRGLNEREIAVSMGIGNTTLTKYKREFAAHIKKGREAGLPELVKTVENSLLKRANGYFVEETITEQRAIIEKGKPVGYYDHLVKTNRKYMAPSDTAIIFYLVNKSGGAWESINQMIHPTDNDKGSILDAIKEMRKKPVK